MTNAQKQATFKFNNIIYSRSQFVPVVDTTGKVVGIAQNDAFIGKPPKAISVNGDVYRKESYNVNLRPKYTWITRKPIRKLRTIKIKTTY